MSKASVMFGGKDLSDKSFREPNIWEEFTKDSQFKSAKFYVFNNHIHALENRPAFISNFLPQVGYYYDYYFNNKLILRIGRGVDYLKIQIIHMNEKFRYYEIFCEVDKKEIFIRSGNHPEIKINPLRIDFFLRGFNKSLDNVILNMDFNEEDIALVFIGLFYWSTEWKGW